MRYIHPHRDGLYVQMKMTTVLTACDGLRRLKYDCKPSWIELVMEDFLKEVSFERSE